VRVEPLTSSHNARESERLKSTSCWFAEAMLGEDVLGTGSSRTAGVGLDRASASLKESLVGSEKVPPTAAGMIALSLPLAEGVGKLELAVVFIPFRSGTEDLDGVMGATRITLVAAHPPAHRCLIGHRRLTQLEW